MARFTRRMPSRAPAVCDLLKRGLVAEGFDLAKPGRASGSYGMIDSGKPTKTQKAAK
jgi:hypothetical protein